MNFFPGMCAGIQVTGYDQADDVLTIDDSTDGLPPLLFRRLHDEQ